MDIEKLKTVLAVDHPVTGAYSGDAEVAAAQLNAVNVDRDRTIMTGAEVASHVNNGEYDLLSDAKKAQIIALTALGSVNPFGFAANVVKDIFAVGSVTLNALAAARTETVSQATAQGLGFVRPGNVLEARA